MARLGGEGSSGGPRNRTLIATQPSGDERRVQQWQNARWHYQVGMANRSPDQLRAIQAFLVARRGSLNAFKVRDPLDYSTASAFQGTVTGDDVEIGTGDGIETRFQMVKRYDVGAYEYARPLRRPRERQSICGKQSLKHPHVGGRGVRETLHAVSSYVPRAPA